MTPEYPDFRWWEGGTDRSTRFRGFYLEVLSGQHQLTIHMSRDGFYQETLYADTWESIPVALALKLL